MAEQPVGISRSTVEAALFVAQQELLRENEEGKGKAPHDGGARSRFDDVRLEGKESELLDSAVLPRPLERAMSVASPGIPSGPNL